jgi:hypothetical protein
VLERDAGADDVDPGADDADPGLSARATGPRNQPRRKNTKNTKNTRRRR